MSITKSEISTYIRDREIEITAALKQGKYTVPKGFNPVVFVAKISPRKYHVGWHFEPTGIVEGCVIPFDDGTVNGSTAIVHLVITYRGK